MVKRDRVSRISNVNYVDAIDSFSITMIIDFNIDLKKITFFSCSMEIFLVRTIRLLFTSHICFKGHLGFKPPCFKKKKKKKEAQAYKCQI